MSSGVIEKDGRRPAHPRAPRAPVHLHHHVLDRARLQPAPPATVSRQAHPRRVRARLHPCQDSRRARISHNHRQPNLQQSRALRKEARWSQAELGQRIGSDGERVSRYEAGRITPSAEALIRLAERSTSASTTSSSTTSPAGPSEPPKTPSATASPPSRNSTTTPSPPSTASSTASSPAPASPPSPPTSAERRRPRWRQSGVSAH